jgi:hypothetical protein
MTNDRSPNAPAGAPQVPTLLNGYATQLSPQVAVGAVPDWRLAALGLFTVNDPAEDAITDQKFWDLIQDPYGGHFRVNSIERAPGTVIDVPASKIGEVSGTVSDALQAQSLDGGGGSVTAASTVGTAMTIMADITAGVNATITYSGNNSPGTLTVSDGTHTANIALQGNYCFTTAALPDGSYAFTATDTSSAETSPASSAFDLTVSSSSPAPSGSNLVANGNFATGDFTDWTLGGNSDNGQIFITTEAQGNSTYAALGSMGVANCANSADPADHDPCKFTS